MKIKILAVALTLLQLLPMASAATLGDYPTFLFEDNNLVGYVVVGADAASEDVVGAVDVAVRLAAESYEEVSTGGSSTTVTGGKKEDVPLGKGIADGFLKISMSDNDLVGLMDSAVNFQGTEYDFHEEIVLNTSTAGASPQICTSLGCGDDDYKSGIYMEVARGSWGYYYVFDETINVSTASSTEPLEIEFLGRTIKITSVADQDTLTATVGDSFSMNVGDTVTVEGHEVTLIDVSSTGSVRVDVDGEYYTVSSSTTKTVGDIQIKVDTYFYRDAREDSAATLIIGEKAVQTYSDSGAYIGQNENDPDWVWDIDCLTSNAAGDTTASSTCSGGVTLGIVNDYVINGDDDNPITAGGEYMLPSDYGSISFTALTVADDDYKTLTIEYESDADLSDVESTWVSEAVIKISLPGVDEGLWLDATTSSDKVWIHHNNTNITDILYEDTNNQVQRFTTITNDETSDSNIVCKVDYDDTDAANNNIVFRLVGSIYTANELNLTLDISGDSSTYIDTSTGADDITINLRHGAQSDFSGIGATAQTNEAGELYWGAAKVDISTKDDDHRSLYGIIIKDPKSHSASDEVVLEIPNNEVFATVVVKGPGTTVTTADGDAVKNVVPITTAVSKLDTEVSLPVDRPLVLVGGPAVNSLTARALGYTYPSYGDTVTEVSEGEGYIAVTEDMVEEGQIAVVVFGYNAADTRKACSVLQKYETFSDQLGDNVAVKVTDVSASGITAAEATTTTTTVASE